MGLDTLDMRGALVGVLLVFEVYIGVGCGL